MTLFLIISLAISNFQSGKLIKTEITQNITMQLPADFRPMTDDEIASKYFAPRKPLALYTDNSLNVDLGVNKSTTSWDAKDLEIMMSFQKSNIYSLYDEINMLSEGTKEINGNQFAYFEFESTIKSDENSFIKESAIRKYTYLQYIIIKEQTFVFNFNCPIQLKNVWSEKALEMMESISIKGKIK